MTTTFTSPRINAGPIVIDADARTVRVNGRLAKQFTKKEFAVLLALARQPEACVDRDRIIRQVWGPLHVDRSGYRTLDTHVMGVRRKLRAVAPASGLVETVWGVGFRLLPANHEEDS